MAKYHVTKNGTPGVCKAHKGNCPLGGPGEHFESVQAAQEYADKKNDERLNGQKEINGVKVKKLGVKASEHTVVDGQSYSYVMADMENGDTVQIPVSVDKDGSIKEYIPSNKTSKGKTIWNSTEKRDRERTQTSSIQPPVIVDDEPLDTGIKSRTYNKLKKFVNSTSSLSDSEKSDGDKDIPNSVINKVYNASYHDPQQKQILDYTIDYETLKKFDYGPRTSLKYMALKADKVKLTNESSLEVNQVFDNKYNPRGDDPKNILRAYVNTSTDEKINTGISTDRIKYSKMLRNNYLGIQEQAKEPVKLKDNEVLAKMKLKNTHSSPRYIVNPDVKTQNDYEMEFEIEGKTYTLTSSNKKALKEITKRSGYDNGIRGLSKTRDYNFGIEKHTNSDGVEGYLIDGGGAEYEKIFIPKK